MGSHADDAGLDEDARNFVDAVAFHLRQLKNHCWHLTGRSSTKGMAATEHENVCCFCGTTTWQAGRDVVRRGHGKHFTPTDYTLEELPQEECPERRKK